MENYWDILINDESFSREDLFLKVRDHYTTILRRLYDDPADIPDYRIYFSQDQVSIEQGMTDGYTVCAIGRKNNRIQTFSIHDLYDIENFENAYTWFQDDVFVVFDFCADGISPLQFITKAFFEELFNQILNNGIKRVKIGYMYELLISSGIVEFFYGFYRLNINFLQTLSATTYESSYADSRIIVPRYEYYRTSRTTGLKVEFSDPIPFNAENLRQVRKLLELSDDKLALVIGESGKIRGLTNEKPLVHELEIQIRGHLYWNIIYEGYHRISYWNGRYHISLNKKTVLTLQENLGSLSATLSEMQLNRLETVIMEAAKQTHGTIIMIGSPEDVASETARLFNMKRCIGIRKINLEINREIVPSLTSIDGALFIDTDCNCMCIGAILDGDVASKGSMARGARFNSTLTYVRRQAQLSRVFTGIVMSEDGTVDAITVDKVIRLNIGMR